MLPGLSAFCLPIERGFLLLRVAGPRMLALIPVCPHGRGERGEGEWTSHPNPALPFLLLLLLLLLLFSFGVSFVSLFCVPRRRSLGRPLMVESLTLSSPPFVS